MKRSTIQIAIDGTAASGKSTVARMLAQKLGLSYLDTGKLYRAVALTFLGTSQPDPQSWDEPWAIEQLSSTTLTLKAFPNDECRVMLMGQDVTDRLGEPEVETATPFAARIPAVRAWLLDLQRDLAQTSDVVLAGRDIGTVVLPEATLKVFMQANLKERARRRLSQHNQDFSEQELERAVEDLRARDERDANRECAPMKAAEDALHLDSSQRTPEELVDEIARRLENLKARTGQRK